MRKIIVGIMIGFVSFAGIVGAQSLNKEESAIAVAKEWVALVDTGKYKESWEAAAGYFKTAVPEEQWVQSIPAVREPLGKVLSREVVSAAYKTSLPGAPDGEYVVVQFATSFENKETAGETITPMIDEDGTWRVAGYYIQ